MVKYNITFIPGLMSVSNLGKRKIDRECRAFKERWELLYFFVEVMNIPTCLICEQNVAVSKEYNVRRHYNTKHSKIYDQYTGNVRNDLMRDLKKSLELSRGLILKNKFSNSTANCSYATSEDFSHAANSVRESDLIQECFLSAAETLCSDQKPVFSNPTPKNIPSLGDMDEEVLHNNLSENIKSFIAFSVAVIQNTDVQDTGKLAIFIRGVDNNFDVIEELIDITTMVNPMKGSDLFLYVERNFKKFNLDFSKLVSVTTNCSPEMVATNDGLISNVKSSMEEISDQNVKCFHCIIHQESLCAEKLKMNHVMDIVIETIEWLCVNGLNRRQFRPLFDELNAHYTSLSNLSGLKWLSRGLVLSKYFVLLKEIELFMTSSGKPIPQLAESEWAKDLAFMVDLTNHLNTFTNLLKEPSQLVTQMYDKIRTFQAKLSLWEKHLKKNNLINFPTLNLMVTIDQNDLLRYISKIIGLKFEFLSLFSEFKQYDNELKLFSSPFSIHMDNVQDEELQTEVIELQFNEELKEKFYQLGVPSFYKHLGEDYPKYKDHCARLLTMFASTAAFEQVFASGNLVRNPMKHNQMRKVNKLTGENPLINCGTTSFTYEDVTHQHRGLRNHQLMGGGHENRCVDSRMDERDIVSEARNALQFAQSLVSNSEESKEELFGKFVAGELKQIKDAQIYNQTKWKLQVALHEGLQEQAQKNSDPS